MASTLPPGLGNTPAPSHAYPPIHILSCRIIPSHKLPSLQRIDLLFTACSPDYDGLLGVSVEEQQVCQETPDEPPMRKTGNDNHL